MSKKVMISTGETSGEMYGALLSRELKKLWPDIQISGIGGHRMEQEGVELIAPITHVLGLVEAVKHVWEGRKTLIKSEQFLMNAKPDVLVLIDYPDFNIALAKKAKALNIPIVYYVSPQVWAWRAGRINTIASLVTRMAVLFPFEVAYYENTGLPCEFVGHPIAETVEHGKSKEELKVSLGLDRERKVISLLPGSRPNELKKHQYIIMEVAAKINRQFPDMQIVVPLAPGTEFPAVLPGYIKVLHGKTSEVLACSEVAGVASGTATLETGLIGTPMVVFYKLSPVTFLLARILTNLQFVALVNILSGKEVVREFLQRDANGTTVFSEIKKILEDSGYRNTMIDNLNKVRELMAGRKPSLRVAEIVGETAGWSKP